MGRDEQHLADSRRAKRTAVVKRGRVLRGDRGGPATKIAITNEGTEV